MMQKTQPFPQWTGIASGETFFPMQEAVKLWMEFEVYGLLCAFSVDTLSGWVESVFLFDNKSKKVSAQITITKHFNIFVLITKTWPMLFELGRSTRDWKVRDNWSNYTWKVSWHIKKGAINREDKLTWRRVISCRVHPRKIRCCLFGVFWIPPFWRSSFGFSFDSLFLRRLFIQKPLHRKVSVNSWRAIVNDIGAFLPRFRYQSFNTKRTHPRWWRCDGCRRLILLSLHCYARLLRKSFSK